MAHGPSRFVGTETERAMDLQSADALLAGQHHVDDAEPIAKGLVGILEDGPGDHREPIAAVGRAGVALPLEGHCGDFVGHVSATTRAFDAQRPAVRHQIALAGVVVRESLFPVPDGHLMDAFAGLLHGRSLLATGGR